MRIIAKRTLREFWQSHPEYADAQAPLAAWHKEVTEANWETPQQVKAQFRNASILKDSRVVYIRFVGTHQQYDTINVETI
ncbi:MAG: type II toxin-antitoxin system HigB family toxin [Gammaproteobacteria bacterium]|nr:type II toxin-antitoxin system HigB family toxin [Gammaproteobacteria bacterium]